MSKTCEYCRHYLYICCDYGACRLLVDKSASAIETLEQAADNLVDGQGETCSRFNPWEAELGLDRPEIAK